jgi:hypothetical protein
MVPLFPTSRFGVCPLRESGRLFLVLLWTSAPITIIQSVPSSR